MKRMAWQTVEEEAKRGVSKDFSFSRDVEHDVMVLEIHSRITHESHFRVHHPICRNITITFPHPPLVPHLSLVIQSVRIMAWRLDLIGLDDSNPES